MLQNTVADVRYAIRWLVRSPGFTLVAIASLAIGIGFNTAVFTIVDAALFRPLPVERPDRLVDVFTGSRDGERYSTSSYPDYLDFKSHNDVFSDMLAFSMSLDAVSMTDRSRLALGEVVSGNYFQLLGIKPQIGRTLAPEDDRPGAPRVVVISHRLWVRDYGSSLAVVGQPMRIHGQAYSIVGVAPPEFTGLIPIIMTELWKPLAYVEEGEPGGIIDTVPSPTGTNHLDRRGQRWLFIKGRLKEGETFASANANLPVVMKQLSVAYPETNKDRSVALVPTNSVRIHPDADRVLMPIATGLMVVVGLVLLIACANVASMLLARASGRQREIAIRLAIGASRRRLVQQLITESAILAILGAVAGVALAWLLARLVVSIKLPLPIQLTLGLQIDGRVLAFTTVVAFVAALAAGLAPAFKATRPALVGELKGEVSGARVGGRRWSLRDTLVAIQMAVTMVLLVSAGLLTRSLMSAESAGIGFRPDGLAIVSTDLNLIGYSSDRAHTFFERALERVRAIPGVQSAGLAERTPMSINYVNNRFFMPERQDVSDKGIELSVTTVSADYFPTIGVPILEGRNFTPSDTPTSPDVIVVNEAMARRFWPNQSPLGQRIRTRGLDGPAYEIVGVVPDYKVSTIGEKPTPYVHFAYTQSPQSGEAIMARTHGDAGALVTAIRRELVALEPNVVFVESQTMEGQIGATLLPARFGAIGVSAVGIVAMVLAAVGLYGVIAYSVARRTREIGIRMALGAEPGSVVSLVMKQGLAVAGAGALVGLLLAFVAAKAIAGALYGVSYVDPVAWIAALVTLFVVSALANLVPAGRASRVSPSVALRTE